MAGRTGEFKIVLQPVTAEASPAGEAVKVDVGGVSITVYPEREAGGPEKGLTPLGLLAASLASCEVLMSRLVGRMLGYNSFDVRVSVTADVQVGEGLRSLSVKYVFKGIEPSAARLIVGKVKELCPVYNTLARNGVTVKEEVRVE
ncbi:OsmC family protein [Aeropyrum camini]|uniref:Predicted redox protein n=1 Tax=Aeropyrum camini SY1 = JCM 12091 TaxID=1198449 RepID=U3TFN6_9CREN|nr:OsmC family protein [Aeropyrum camini]BAN90855.1 predicted redox protein [Aeropyrum camini SY1 = JCM 12091]